MEDLKYKKVKINIIIINLKQLIMSKIIMKLIKYQA